MISSIVSRFVILLFGTLYPAYASYKAVRTKDMKEYIKWMMYWIVFALFTCAETFTDVFIGFWFPFYYEIKIILVIWLLSPATNGSSFLYRNFVHPTLQKREQEIDEAILNAKQQGYHTILNLGRNATTVIMQTAIKGGGGLVNQLRKSYSLTDLVECYGDAKAKPAVLGCVTEERDAADGGSAWNLRRPQPYPLRHSSPGTYPLEMYFSEVDVDVRQQAKIDASVPWSYIRSSEDISSGYSSADPLYTTASPASTPTGDCDFEESLLRTTSVGSARTQRPRKSPRTGSTTLLATKRGSEGSAPLAELDEFEVQLDGLSLPQPLVSQLLLAQISQQLALGGRDFSHLLMNHFPHIFYNVSNTSKSKHSEENEPDTMIPAAMNEGNSESKENVEMPEREMQMNSDPEVSLDSEMVEVLKEPNCVKPVSDDNDSLFHEANTDFDEILPSHRRSSTPVEFEDAIELDDSDIKTDLKKGARAGRYGKLRAPSPPGKQSSETESMSDTESGTIVNARMSLVSSKKSSENVNIMVESEVGSSESHLKEERSSPLVKHRKRTKHTDSRLRNSLGSLTSLFPFWHHRSSENLVNLQHENSPSASSLPSEPEMRSSSNHNGAKKEFTYKQNKANGSERDAGDDHSRSCHDDDKFPIRDMSHSPPRRHWM